MLKDFKTQLYKNFKFNIRLVGARKGRKKGVDGAGWGRHADVKAGWFG